MMFPHNVKIIPVVAKWLWVAGVVVPLAIPWIVTERYYFYMIALSGIWTILALSLNFVVGYTGQVSLCHGSFFGIGAYTSALLVLEAGWSYWLALPGAGLLSGVIGFLIGIPALRSRGPYFAICTLGFGMIVTIILENWISLTGGSNGISNIPPPDSIPIPSLGNILFNSAASQYYLILATIYFMLFFTRRLVDSRTGRAFLAIRRDEALAESIGVDPKRYKLIAFAMVFLRRGGRKLLLLAGSLYHPGDLFDQRFLRGFDLFGGRGGWHAGRPHPGDITPHPDPGVSASDSRIPDGGLRLASFPDDRFYAPGGDGRISFAGHPLE